MVRALVAVGIAMAAALLVVSAQRSPQPSQPVPGFLGAQLGAPAPGAGPVAGGVRTIPAAGRTTVSIAPGAMGASSPAGRVSLSSADAGAAPWEHFRTGASRRTSFGVETVAVARDRVEESLVVHSPQGARTWRWRIGARGLTARLGSDGSVGFLDGNRLSEMHIAPVAILDPTAPTSPRRDPAGASRAGAPAST